jgi:hypothetical protein
MLRSNSSCGRLEESWWLFSQSVLLGDRAYPLKKWLITRKINDLRGARVQGSVRHTGAEED